MRKGFVLCTALGSLVLTARLASAQVLFTTAADFGGSTLSGDPSQTGWAGWGDRGSSYPPTPSTSNGESLSFSGPDLDGATTNALGNYDNNNDPPYGSGGSDPNFTGSSLVSYAGKSSPGGSLTIVNYGGGYDSVQTGEMFEGGSASGNTPFLNAITQNGAEAGVLSMDFTIPGGAFVSSGYFLLSFDLYDNNTTFSSDAVNAEYNTMSSPDSNGSYVVNNGSYLTAYIPYSLAGKYSHNPFQYMQLVLIVNSGGYPVGNMTFDDVSVSSVPEPASLSALGLSVGGLLMRRRRTA